MKRLWTPSLLVILAMSGFSQTEPVDLTADKLIRESALLRGVGHARAKAGALVLQADEATLNRETGALEMRGHVHITLPAREDHTVVRYGAAVLLTDQPIGLTADRATLKNGLLLASGGIVLLPVDPDLPDVQLRGEELSMFLRIADATLRGNVRTTNLTERVVYPHAIRIPSKVFPPDIIR